jgi:hypothetical protein
MAYVVIAVALMLAMVLSLPLLRNNGTTVPSKNRSAVAGEEPQSLPRACRQLAIDALHELETLESACSVGLDLEDYESRVTQAKIKTDAFIRAAGKSSDTALLIELSSLEYLLALEQWRASIRQNAPNLYKNEIQETWSKCRGYNMEARQSLEREAD